MKTLGRYQVHELVGRGGMGEVYLAHDPALARDVAIKMLPASLAESQPLVERFLSEARHAAQLDHPSTGTCTRPSETRP